jgi:glycosyltransferase involved in cell wall biosynthesis
MKVIQDAITENYESTLENLRRIHDIQSQDLNRIKYSEIGMNSKPQPLVTIGIPTYNRADSYLKQTLRSSMNQTYENIEIIVSDNCSSDDTEAVVRSFNDRRIRYFRQHSNIAANDNFNFCLSQAEGDYFLLLHDDDLIDNDFVGSCMDKRNNVVDIGIIRTGTRIIDENGSVLRLRPNMADGLSTEDFFLSWFENKTALFFCSTVFNTHMLKQIGGFQSKRNLFQDGIAVVKLAANFGRLDISDIKASFRRHSAEQITHSAKVRHWCEDSIMLLDIMCDLAKQKSEEIKEKGLRFFARLNYRRAASVRPLPKRLFLLLYIFLLFSCRQARPLAQSIRRKLWILP